VRRAVLNRLINEEQAEQGDGGYLTRLSKGQLECRTELADLAERCDVTITEVRLGCLVPHTLCTPHCDVLITEVPLFGMCIYIQVRRCPSPHMHIYLQVPLFDMEVRAPPGLRAMGSAMFDGDAKD